MRSLLPTTLRAALRHPPRAKPVYQQRYICANCLRAASRIEIPRGANHHSQRNFSIQHQRRSGVTSSSARADSVIPQTHYDLFPDTFPDGPPPKTPFLPDLKRLRKEFLQLQAKAHPDLARPEQKRQAEAMSAMINEAYKTLQDPLRRAQYLLSLADIDVEDESMKLSENALLMEVMEAREAIEEVESEDELVSLKEENQQRIDESVNTLSTLFETGDLDSAAQEAVRLRYWRNIEESIQGWEKGQGGGILHH